MAEYTGEYCKNLGLTINEFYRASTHPPTMKIVNIKKGAIYELSQIQKSRGTSWIKFYESVKSVCDSSFTTSTLAFSLERAVSLVGVGKWKENKKLKIRL